MILAVGAVGLVLALPSLSALYRRFGSKRRSGLVTCAVVATSAATWLVLGALMPAVRETALYIPALALAAFGGYLGTLLVRELTTRLLTVLGCAAVWTGAVFTPVAVLVLFPQALGSPLASGALDFGGVIAVHVTGGCAALVALVLAPRHFSGMQLAHLPHPWQFAVFGLSLWAGWICLLVSLELELNTSTIRIVESAIIAPLASTAAWLVVQRIRLQTTTMQGATAGMVCGLVAVGGGSAYLAPLSAGVTGASAGLACATFVLLRVQASGVQHWFLVGAHLIAAGVGLVMLGIFGTGRGFVFTGQLVMLQANVVAIGIASALACAVSLAMVAIVLLLRLGAPNRLEQAEETTAGC